ncbi:MAG TPA: VOC family protein [Polyangiaceae bacterium]|jgi:catechol 2,3-dioxygenase-like lactoylglutathione lyase family enzyme|nr:VOC family protein [Polyangiaceae bacterium]
MRNLNYLLLAVKNPRHSAVLYTRLLGREPVEAQDTFVLYVLPNGFKLGLWIDSEMQPKPLPAGGVEISFSEDSKESVLASYKEWKGLGLPILQEPTEMDFGFTFVAADPDGHRLRSFVLAVDPK